MRIEIFRTGCHTPSDGPRLCFSDRDLAQTALLYDPRLKPAPLVIGHPESNGPTYGVVSHLWVTKGLLEAVTAGVDPSFKQQVNAGRFKKVSASFYRPDSPANPSPGVYYLRHVGFLGAAAPAIKGLRPVQFTEPSSASGGAVASFAAAAEQGVVEFTQPLTPRPRSVSQLEWGPNFEPSRWELHLQIVAYAERHGVGYLSAARALEKGGAS